MSLDKSLKIKNALRRHRNVLTRAERVQQMVAQEKWTDDQDVYGLPKTKVRRLVVKKAKPAAEKEGEGEGEGEGVDAEATAEA